MSKPVLCKHKRFDGARCVLNDDHLEYQAVASHGYAYRSAVSEELWIAAKTARAWFDCAVDGPTDELLGEYEQLLAAVEKEMKR